MYHTPFFMWQRCFKNQFLMKLFMLDGFAVIAQKATIFKKHNL